MWRPKRGNQVRFAWRLAIEPRAWVAISDEIAQNTALNECETEIRVWRYSDFCLFRLWFDNYYAAFKWPHFNFNSNTHIHIGTWEPNSDDENEFASINRLHYTLATIIARFLNATHISPLIESHVTIRTVVMGFNEQITEICMHYFEYLLTCQKLLMRKTVCNRRVQLIDYCTSSWSMTPSKVSQTHNAQLTINSDWNLLNKFPMPAYVKQSHSEAYRGVWM